MTPSFGGGIYRLTLSGSEWMHEKEISGNCYGMTRFQGDFVTLDTDRGIVQFDANANVIREKQLPQGIRAHGIDYSEDRQEFYIIAATKTPS